MRKTMSVRTLAITAALIAAATALHMLKIVRLPMGGSITPFSMFFAFAPGWLFGPAVGAVGGLAYGLLQIVLDPYIVHPVQFLLDYILAFIALGAAGGLVKNLYAGYAAAVSARYACHLISGYVFFAAYTPENWNPIFYAIVYNAAYIFPEAAITLIALSIPQVRQALLSLYSSLNQKQVKS